MNRSSQVLSLSVPSTASTTTYGAAVALPNSALGRHVKIMVAMQAHTGGTLNLYLQESLDGGTTWWDCCAFPQVTAATASNVVVPIMLNSLTAYAVRKGTTASAVPVLAAGTYTGGPYGPLLRLVAVTGTGTSGAAQVQTATFVVSE